MFNAGANVNIRRQYKPCFLVKCAELGDLTRSLTFATFFIGKTLFGDSSFRPFCFADITGSGPKKGYGLLGLIGFTSFSDFYAR